MWTPVETYATVPETGQNSFAEGVLDSQNELKDQRRKETMDLTEKILNGLRGRIDITVSHHEIAGVLRVVGASNDTI